MNKKILFTAAMATFGLVGGVIPTVEAAPPGTGFDDLPDVVIGGGSDTTYLVGQRLEALYNSTPGCTIVTSSSSASKGLCQPGQTAPANGNFDHDIFVGATPTGSSAGVVAITTGPQYNPPIDYARSSRGPASTAETNVATFWGYASDGIAILSFGNRTGVAVTKQQMKDIYTCQLTDWSQLGQPAGPIIPWDMNAASGTTASFRTFVDNVTFGTCVRKLTNGTAPFENDVKPLLSDAGPDGIANTADDDENNFIWWMSYANWKTYPYTTGAIPTGAAANVSSNLVSVEGATPSDSSIFNRSYPIVRTIFHVTREGDADCNSTVGTEGVCTTGPEVHGTTVGGKGGAVREFTEWLCRTSNAQQQINVVTGRGMRTEIVSAITAEGFQQLSPSVAGLRTPGYSCQVFN